MSNNCIKREQSCWQPVEQPWHLPSGRTPSQALERHCMPDLLTRYGANCSTQYIVHRGDFDPTTAPENTMAAFLNVLDQGGALFEADVMMLKNSPGTTPDFVYAHDLTPWRIIGRDEDEKQRLWQSFTLKELEHLPILVRQVHNGRFTEKYYVTNQQVTSVLPSLTVFKACNPHFTAFLDARNDHAGPLVAVVSHKEEFLNNVVIQTYPYFYDSADHLIRNIFEHHPAPSWRKVAVLPVVRVRAIGRRAVGTAPLPYERLRESAIAWITSFLESGLRIAGVGLPIYGPGRRYKPTTNTATDASGVQITNAKLLRAYQDDHATMELFQYLRRNYPAVPLRGLIRGPDIVEKTKDTTFYYKYSFSGGNPDEWGYLHDFCAEQATPGLLIELGFRFDMVVCDRFRDCISYEECVAAGSSECSMSVDYPRVTISSRYA